MALQAGRVGVAPDQVDEYGKITGCGDTYTKAQIDNKLNNKVSKAQLTANDSQFYFDYQNEQYGYNTSADRGADTFHPFSGSGVTPMISFIEKVSYGSTFHIPQTCDFMIVSSTLTNISDVDYSFSVSNATELETSSTRGYACVKTFTDVTESTTVTGTRNYTEPMVIGFDLV